MKNRDQELDRYLSGERSIDQLTGPLRLEEQRLQEAMMALRETVQAPPSLRDSIMREVAEIRLPLWRRVSDWWLSPRTVRLSPAAASLVLAVAVAALVFWPSTPSVVDPAVAPSGAVTQVVTRFILVAPEASSVHLTGDFASWSPEGIRLEDLRGTGVWSADVPLGPGVYQYTFIIDGTDWRPDPMALSQVADGFGQVNSVVIVSPENAA